MFNYPDLDLAWTDLQGKDELYRPTTFWRDAYSQIRQEIIDKGVDNFRKLSSALSFFVPTYGPPGNSLDSKIIKDLRQLCGRHDSSTKAKLFLEQFLSGESTALADYRVLLAADDFKRKPYLHKFSESKFGNPVEQFEFDNRRFSRSSLNYLLGFSILKRHLEIKGTINVLEIGGGFGSLGEIVATSGFTSWHYIDIDIPPISFIAQTYLASALGKNLVTGYVDTLGMDEIRISDLTPASALCSWQIEKLVGKVDLFVNFISFQEMELSVVANYLSHVDRLEASWVLLRNMREGKQIKTLDCPVGVENPIKSADYISLLSKYTLIERNVLPFGYRTVDGFHSELLLFRRNK